MRLKLWITSGIRKSIKRKNKLYKKYLSTKNEYYKSKYKCYRNKLNHLQHISKKTIMRITLLLIIRISRILGRELNNLLL
jgi:hypothetical protein